MNIAELIKLERKKLGLTQKRFAEMLKCRAATVSDIETGKHKPSGEIIEAFMKQFNYKLTQIKAVKL